MMLRISDGYQRKVHTQVQHFFLAPPGCSVLWISICCCIDRHAVSSPTRPVAKGEGHMWSGGYLGCRLRVPPPVDLHLKQRREVYTINGTCANPGNDWNTDWCVGRPPCRHIVFH